LDTFKISAEGHFSGLDFIECGSDCMFEKEPFVEPSQTSRDGGGGGEGGGGPSSTQHSMTIISL